MAGNSGRHPQLVTLAGWTAGSRAAPICYAQVPAVRAGPSFAVFAMRGLLFHRHNQKVPHPSKNRKDGAPVLHAAYLLIIQSFSFEDLRYALLNPCLSSLGLFGSREIVNVASLPSRRKRVKSGFQGSAFL